MNVIYFGLIKSIYFDNNDCYKGFPNNDENKLIIL